MERVWAWDEGYTGLWSRKRRVSGYILCAEAGGCSVHATSLPSSKGSRPACSGDEACELLQGSFLSSSLVLISAIQSRCMDLYSARLILIKSQAHPFLPNPISRAAHFLISHSRLTEWEWGRSTNETRREVDELLGVLRDLQATNNLAKELLGEMEGAQTRMQTTVGMANGLGTGLGNNQRGETAYRHGRSYSENMRGGIS
jgi:hypothetical protein